METNSAAEQAFTITVRRVIVQEQTVTVTAASLAAAKRQAKELAADLGEACVASEIGAWRIAGVQA